MGCLHIAEPHAGNVSMENSKEEDSSIVAEGDEPEHSREGSFNNNVKRKKHHYEAVSKDDGLKNIKSKPDNSDAVIENNVAHSPEIVETENGTGSTATENDLAEADRVSPVNEVDIPARSDSLSPDSIEGPDVSLTGSTQQGDADTEPVTDMDAGTVNCNKQDKPRPRQRHVEDRVKQASVVHNPSKETVIDDVPLESSQDEIGSTAEQHDKNLPATMQPSMLVSDATVPKRKGPSPTKKYPGKVIGSVQIAEYERSPRRYPNARPLPVQKLKQEINVDENTSASGSPISSDGDGYNIYHADSYVGARLAYAQSADSVNSFVRSDASDLSNEHPEDDREINPTVISPDVGNYLPGSPTVMKNGESPVNSGQQTSSEKTEVEINSLATNHKEKERNRENNETKIMEFVGSGDEMTECDGDSVDVESEVMCDNEV